jgi:hypothetical protein
MFRQLKDHHDGYILTAVGQQNQSAAVKFLLSQITTYLQEHR